MDGQIPIIVFLILILEFSDLALSNIGATKSDSWLLCMQRGYCGSTTNAKTIVDMLQVSFDIQIIPRSHVL